MTSTSVFGLTVYSFQLTSSQGGWLLLCLILHSAFTFQLTSSQGGWLVTPSGCPSPVPLFQLTSSQGGWPLSSACASILSYFNSHPHKEDDLKLPSATAISSIFQLTSSQGGWRQIQNQCSLYRPISTHILTRRMTSHLHLQNLNHLYFNSHPHKEDDSHPPTQQRLDSISTHILTRRMTVAAEKNFENRVISTHILTRRMTQCSTEYRQNTNYFNSHPHKEDDVHYSLLRG